MATARFGIDPRRIAVIGGLLATTSLFGGFVVGVWRAISNGGTPVTEVVFTLAVFFVATLFFLSTVEDPASGGTYGPIAVGGGLLGAGVALLAPVAWSNLTVLQLLTYPFVLVWILALVATDKRTPAQTTDRPE